MPEFLSSKLTPPVSAIKPVPRSRLCVPKDFLQKRQAILALSAPAGYGKSTLMTQWWLALEGENTRCLWLGLDVLDAAAERFEQALLGALHSPEGLDLQAALVHFEQAQQPAVLFIDDLHFIHAQDAEHVLSWLLSHLPTGLQLIMAGRGLPESLGLSRWVLEGRATRYDARDLALTQGELATLLKVPAESDWLPALHVQTEGWPLAARIVSLSQDDAGRVLPPSGRDRDLSAYLTDVLLNGLPASLRQLVFAAALLPRFCADQLNAVLDISGSEPQLRWLEENNLFLIPLDRERRWYRFHHLISEFLASRLAAENVADMHVWQQRAADWCQEQGYVEDAIDLALAAENYELAAEQLEAVVAQMAQHDGRHERVVNWVSQLPEAVLKPRYMLRLNHIVAMTFTGELAWSRQAALTLLKDVLGNVDAQQEVEFQSAAEIFVCIIAALEDEPNMAEELSNEWLGQWSQGSPLFVGVAFSTRGYAAKCRSAFDEALASTQRGKQLFIKAGSVYGEAWAAALQAITYLRMGSLSQARETAEGSRNAAIRRLGMQASSVGTLSAILASICLEQGDVEAARSALDFDFSVLGQTSADGLIAAWMTAARLEAAEGRIKSAQALLLSGESVGQERSLPRLVLSLAAERAVNHIRAGRLELARNIVTSEFAPYESREDLAPLIEDKRVQLQVRLSLAAGDGAAALPDIAAQLQAARVKEQTLKIQQWLVFSAAASRLAGAEDAGSGALVEALQLAESTGAVRILLADADLIRGGLQEAFDAAAINAVFADRVRQLVGVEALAANSQLTKKEQQILAAMAEGLSNRELSMQLFVSEGTVKWHLHNIYSKLDAKSRSEALVKARAAGLIA